MKLFGLFSQKIFSYAKWTFVGTSILPLVMQKLGVSLFSGPLLLVFAVCMIVPLVIQQQLVSANLTWLRSTPYSKKEIVLINFLLGLFAYAMIIFATLTGVFILLMIDRSEVIKEFEGLNGSSFQVAVGFFRETFNSMMKEGLTDNYIDSVVIKVGAVVIFLSILLGIGQRRAQAQQLVVDPKQRQKMLVRVYVALAGVYVLFQTVLYPIRHYWATTFVMYSAVIVGVLIFNAERTITALAFPLKIARRHLTAVSCLSMALISFFWFVGQHELHSDSSIRRARGVLFLGGLSGKLSEKSLAEVLNSKLDKEAIEKISKIYRDNFTNDELIRADSNRSLSFQSMIANKSRAYDLAAVVDQWNISSLDATDIAVFYKKTEGLQDYGYLSKGYDLLAAKITNAELADMLVVRNNDGKANLLTYALLRAKYHREPEYINVILAQLPQYSDGVKGVALNTLSALVGEKTNVEKYISYRMGKQLNKKFFNPDCALLESKNSERVIQEMSDANLNVCLRDKVFKSHNIGRMITFDNMGWLSKPLRTDQVELVKKIVE